MADIPVKLCSKCQLSKPLTEFYEKKRLTRIDYATRCKVCCIEDNKERKAKVKSGERPMVTRVLTDYKSARSAICTLTQEEFDKACEMARNYCPITTLSKFIKCSQPTTKKYIQQGLFGSLK